MVAAVVDEVTGKRPNGVSSHPLPVHLRVEKDVDGRMPVIGIVLVPVLHHPAHGTVEEDGEPNRRSVIEGPLTVGFTPMTVYFGRGDDATQLGGVRTCDGHQHHTKSMQRRPVIGLVAKHDLIIAQHRP